MILGNGELVFVRVLSCLGGSSYEVSARGMRFVVSSHRPLSPGMAFKARVRLARASIELIPDCDHSPDPSSLLDPDAESGLFPLLNRLGLSRGEVPPRILSLLQESPSLLIPSIMSRLRDTLLSFGAEESLEAFISLARRGFDPERRAVEAVLACMRMDWRAQAEKKEALGALGAFYGTDPVVGTPGMLTLLNQTAGTAPHIAELPFACKAGKGVCSFSTEGGVESFSLKFRGRRQYTIRFESAKRRLTLSCTPHLSPREERRLKRWCKKSGFPFDMVYAENPADSDPADLHVQRIDMRV